MTILRYCPACAQQVVPMDDGRCAWCDGPTSKPRGGWKRPDLAGSRLTDDHLRVLYRVYLERGVSINQLAKQVHERLGYRSHHSCATTISEGWKRLGLPARDRIAAVKLACTVHGMAPKHGPRPGYGTHRRRLHQPDQPTCAGVKLAPPRKGEPCQRPAQFGSVFCLQHDPMRALEVQATTARMRKRQPVRPMLPMGPFAAWLAGLRDELGTMRAVADRTGIAYTAVCQYVKGQGTNKRAKATVSVALVKRAALSAGVSVDAIYPSRVREAA